MKNVNQKQGPRVGVSSRAGKTEAFKAGKAGAEALANTINRAFELRSPGDKTERRLEGIHANTNVSRKK